MTSGRPQEGREAQEAQEGQAAPGAQARLEAFLRAIPKVELHCHLAGDLRRETFAHLARKHGAALPASVDELYDFSSFDEFIAVYVLAGTLLRDQDDFARAAYESLADAVANGSLRYREMFFSPTDHFTVGVPYEVMLEGLLAGIEAARADHGVQCRLVPAIDRSKPASAAVELVRTVIEHRSDEVIGIGLDNAERLGPPERFAEAYRLAGRAGLRRTAHACEDNQTLEDAPPRNVTTCLDTLGCERIDHGYNLLADEAVVARCREESIPFTVCSHTSMRANRRRRLDSIAAMIGAGLRVTVNADDPTMFGTDIGQSYVTVCTELGLGPDEARALALESVDASWLDDSDKRALRADLDREIRALRSRHLGGDAAAG